MKFLAILFAWIALIGTLPATDKVVTRMVTIPLYHLLEDAPVRFVKIPHVGWDLNAFWHCELYSKRFIAGHSNLEQEINLISLYGIEVKYRHQDGIDHIDIVTTKAKQPENFKFSVPEVAKLTARAIRLDFPNESTAVISIDGAKPGK